MTNEITQLEAHLNQLSDELRSAQYKIRQLEKRSAWRPNVLSFLGLFFVALLGVSFWTTSAFSRNQPTCTTFLADAPTKLKAPFEVVDNAGKTIFLVQDKDSDVTKLPRGAYVYTVSGKPVVDLSATTIGGGGGRLRVTSEDEQTYAALAAVTNTAIFATYKSGKRTTYVGTEEGISGAIRVFRSDGEKPAASLELQGEAGAVNVFGSGDKPVASIQSDAGDGKLWINDKSGQPVAGVFANDNGGVVKVMKSGEANTYTAINAVNAGLGMAIRKAGKRLVFAGASGADGEKGSVYVYGNGDSPIAGISSYGGGKGLVAVFNASAAIAFMSESDKHPGGGSITVSDPGGNGIFSAGFTGEAGDACVTRKNGLWCMGTNLPLQMK
ncbi:MAG TPA: hypothetical protein VIX17_02715 [Pyrinomonadaceae bacterium]|jgi:hypothetical protein